MRVDEARRDHLAGDVQLEADLAVRHRAQVAHGHDPIAADADVGTHPRGARPIDDAPAAQEQVESRHEGHGATSGRRGRGQRDTATLRVPWGHSSAGRASAWHAEGPGFESPWLHQATRIHTAYDTRSAVTARLRAGAPHRRGPRRPGPPVVHPARVHRGRRGRRRRLAELRHGLPATRHGLPAGPVGRGEDRPRGRRTAVRLPLRRPARPLPVRGRPSAADRRPPTGHRKRAGPRWEPALSFRYGRWVSGCRR